jgi:transposase InsO family protein
MIPAEKISLINKEVVKYKMWAGWTKSEVLKKFGISSSTYYGWKGCVGNNKVIINDLTVLEEEKMKVIEYANLHPSLRHRELSYKMIDDNVAYLSPSSVYRILSEADLVCRWEQKRVKKESTEKPKKPNERWQSDIQYVKIGKRNYYLLLFIDEYSRYIAHHALLREMTGNTVSLEAQAAIEKVTDAKPIIQTDNGSCFISHDFARVLHNCGVGHNRIHPHCPEENGLVERANRTIGDEINMLDLNDYNHGKEKINGIIEWYNTKRLHSAIGYITPYDMHIGRDGFIRSSREVKLENGKNLRIKKNKELRNLKKEAQKSQISEQKIAQKIAQNC